MRYVAAAALGLVSSVASAQADSGQGALKARLEAVRIPIYVDEKTVPGFTGAYSMRSEGCTSFLDVMIPSLMFEGEAHPSGIRTDTLQWAAVTAVEVAGDYVVISLPGAENGKRYLYAGGAEGAQQVRRTVDRLIAACGGRATVQPTSTPAPAQAPTPAPAAPNWAERVAIEPDILGQPQCRVPAVPGLFVIQRTPPAVSGAAYAVVPPEWAREGTGFSFGVEDSQNVTNWQGLLAYDPRFDIRSDRIGAAKVVRADVTLDGSPFSVPITIMHEEAFGQPYSPQVILAPTYYADQDQWFARLERGSIASVTLYDQNGTRFGPWTFDVSSLRNVPAALKASGFGCG